MAAHLLHVFGVNDDANRDGLRKIFSTCGNVVGVDKLGKGSALVGYKEKEEADLALTSLQFKSFDGRVLKIKKSTIFSPENFATVREPNYGYCLREFFCFNYNVYECNNAASGGQCLRGKHYCFHCFLNGMGHLAHRNKDPNCPSRKGGWEELQQYKSVEDRLKPRGNPPTVQPPLVTQHPALVAPQPPLVVQQPQLVVQHAALVVQQPRLGDHTLAPPVDHSQELSTMQRQEQDRLKTREQLQVLSSSSQLGPSRSGNTQQVVGRDSKRGENRENLRNVVAKRKEVSSTDAVGVAAKAMKPSTSGFRLAPHLYNRMSAEEKRETNFLCAPSKPRPGNERGDGEDGQPSIAWSFPSRLMSDGPIESKELLVDKEIAMRISESIQEIEKKSKTSIKYVSSALCAKKMKVYIRGTTKDIKDARMLLESCVKQDMEQFNFAKERARQQGQAGLPPPPPPPSQTAPAPPLQTSPASHSRQTPPSRPNGRLEQQAQESLQNKMFLESQFSRVNSASSSSNRTASMTRVSREESFKRPRPDAVPSRPRPNLSSLQSFNGSVRDTGTVSTMNTTEAISGIRELSQSLSNAGTTRGTVKRMHSIGLRTLGVKDAVVSSPVFRKKSGTVQQENSSVNNVGVGGGGYTNNSMLGGFGGSGRDTDNFLLNVGSNRDLLFSFDNSYGERSEEDSVEYGEGGGDRWSKYL